MQNARFAAAILRASEAYHISHDAYSYNGNCILRRISIRYQRARKYWKIQSDHQDQFPH